MPALVVDCGPDRWLASAQAIEQDALGQRAQMHALPGVACLTPSPPKLGQPVDCKGTVLHVRYTSPDQDFSVVDFHAPGEGRITITGSLSSLQDHDDVRIIGRWVQNRYGLQVRVERFERILPVTKDGIARYISRQVKGFGPAIAERIVNTFGKDTLTVLDRTPQRLLAISGIGKAKLKQFRSEWDSKALQRHNEVFLFGLGVSSTMATRISKRYGADAVRVVQEEPYRLAQEVDGIGFVRADAIARSLGIATDSPERVEAGILHVLLTLEGNEGHCFLYEQDLSDAAVRLLEVPESAVADAIERLVQVGNLVGERAEHGRALFRRLLWWTEKSIAEELARLEAAHTAPPSPSKLKQIVALVRKVEQQLGLELAPQQRAAVEAGLTGKLLVVTGGPGTGKTTLVRLLVEGGQALSLNLFLAAPTGRAAKRLSEATGHEAKTLHRLLEFSFQNNGFQRNADNPLEPGLYVVDESSMIDITLMRSLLAALPDEAQVVFVGDVDQLPSVGPGTVLRDLINSDAIPIVRLDEVFRQASASLIVQNAHRINRGEFPILPERDADKTAEFYLIECRDPEQAERLIEQVVCERLPARFGIDPMHEVQILAPMRRNAGGVDRLNLALQARLNPGGSPIGRHEGALRVGDRVMQLRNDYDKEIFNGDVGRIVAWNAKEQLLSVSFDDRTLHYSADALEDLTLAYACTVHKAQGSEYRAIVVTLLPGHRFMLQRNLVYTAITRAKHVAIIVGDRYTLQAAIHNDKPATRNTLLADRVRCTIQEAHRRHR